MNRGLSIKKEIAGVITLFFLIVWVGFILACAAPVKRPTYTPPKKYLPTSQWGNNYSYRYDPPVEMAPASVNATIIVVNPSYKEAGSDLANRAYLKVGKGFSTSMGVDMDKILIAKGMTSKGPFPSLDEIVYSDKKISDLTFVPKVFITIDVRYIGKWDVEHNYIHEGEVISVKRRNFEMNIGGWVSFVMQEPLSGQKMWIKRLELTDLIVNGEEYHKAIPQYETKTVYDPGFLFLPSSTHRYKVLSGHKPGEILYDGKIDALANGIKNMYPVIIKKCWAYIDAEEIISLKEKVKEIRELKRY